MEPKRTPRDLATMLQALGEQTRLLEEYTSRALAGDDAFIPEIANKLRILVVPIKRTNKPLLFEVAGRLGDVPMVSLKQGPRMLQPDPNEPPPGNSFSLDTFLDSEAVRVDLGDGPTVLSKRQLIRAIAEQLGGAHEDWEVDRVVAAAVTKFPFLGFRPALVELRNISRTVVTHGRRLLALAKDRGLTSDA